MCENTAILLIEHIIYLKSHNDASGEGSKRWGITLLQHMTRAVANIGANEFPLHAAHNVDRHGHWVNLAARLLNLLAVESINGLYAGVKIEIHHWSGKDINRTEESLTHQHRHGERENFHS